MTQPGDTVGGYQLIRALGEGPFGVAWQACDVHGNALAIKILKPSFIQVPAGQAAYNRLVGAVRLHEAIHHEAIARPYGLIQDPTHSAYGMACEFVDGRGLSEVRMPPNAEQDAKSLSVVLAWFENIGTVLAWLHAQGIVHGNLKPTNVKLVRGPLGHTIKILDLSWSSIGLAPPAEGARSYLAPEQLRGAPPSGFSDQFSLATMLAEVLTNGGRIHLGQLPAGLVHTVQRAQHVQPAFRFQQMMEFVGALQMTRTELTRISAYSPFGPFPAAGGANSGVPTANVSGVPPSGMPGVGVPSSGIPGPTSGVPGPTAGAPARGLSNAGAPNPGVPNSGSSGLPGTPGLGGAAYPSFPGTPAAAGRPAEASEESVFVPTARSLETTDVYPMTGEHEVETLLEEPIQTPTVSSPYTDAERAPLGGTPVDASVLNNHRPADDDDDSAGEPVADQPAESDDAVAAESGRSGASRSESGRSGASRSESGRSESDRSESGRSESGRSESGRSGSGRSESGRSESGRSESAPSEAAAFEQPEPVVPSSELARPEGVDAEVPSGVTYGPTAERDPLGPSSDVAPAAVTEPPQVHPRADTVPLPTPGAPDEDLASRWWPIVLLAAFLAAVGAVVAVRWVPPAEEAPVEMAAEDPASPAPDFAPVPDLVDAGMVLDATVVDAGTVVDTGLTASARRPPPPRAVRRAPPPPPPAAPSKPDAAKPPVRRPFIVGSRDAGTDNVAGGRVVPAAPPALSEALEEAQVGCDEGDGEACLEVAAHFNRTGDARSARSAFKRACDFNRKEGCLSAARSYVARPGVAFTLYEKGCQLASADACHEASVRLKSGLGTNRNLTKATEYAKQACQLGRRASCVTTTSTQ